MKAQEVREVEISAIELTTEDLDAVNGGAFNELYNTVMLGVIKGYTEAGGNVSVSFH
jgi:hypothetical protein